MPPPPPLRNARPWRPRARPPARPRPLRPPAPASALPRSPLDRQPGVILGQRAHGGFRARHIVELGALALAIEGVVARIEMKQLRHPPGKALPPPHPPHTRRRITLQQIPSTA